LRSSAAPSSLAIPPEFRRALELNPNNATAHYFYAFTFLVPEKRIDQALLEFRIALSLDPLSPIVNTNYATTLMIAGRYSESLTQFRKTHRTRPKFPAGPLQTVTALRHDWPLRGGGE
jgi:Tfp pilus assembly protein PilF